MGLGSLRIGVALLVRRLSVLGCLSLILSRLRHGGAGIGVGKGGGIHADAPILRYLSMTEGRKDPRVRRDRHESGMLGEK